MIKIKCINNNSENNYPLGTKLSDIIKNNNIKLKYRILGALVNNELEELSYSIFKPKIVEFLDISHKDGMRMYVRSLYFILMKAVYELYPKSEVKIEHSVSGGYFCEMSGNNIKLTSEIIKNIKQKMHEIIEANYIFERTEILTSEAVKIFEKNNLTEKARLFRQTFALFTSVYSLDNYKNYFYGYLVPSTNYVSKFDLIPLYDGMLLQIPERKNPLKLRSFVKQDKMFDILKEHKYYVSVLNAQNVGRLNAQILEGEAGELIKIAEALHEKKIAEIAEKIKADRNKKLILISGPSSSGKTTFSKRLSVQLKVIGLKPIQISIDNYFVNREETPLDEYGKRDYEALGAIDIKLFNENINDLKAGKTVKIPKFDFETGKKIYDGTELKINEETIIIAEGIHALNPNLTKNISGEIKYKIYVSALTQICIDLHNRIPTTDNRLLRRIIRDKKYRNYSTFETLQRWDSVRRGEEKNIFPFQEEADIMFNSALLYELGVLKKHTEPLLKNIQQNKKEHAEAQRLLKFLSYFKYIDEEEIPPTSILREFLGKSSFHY